MKAARLLGLLLIFSLPALAQKYYCDEELFLRRDKRTRLMGYVNLMGEERVPPTFIKAFAFEGKNAVVMLGSQYGVIDCSGKLVVGASYDEVYEFYYGRGWGKRGETWYPINDQGKEITQYAYTEVRAAWPRSIYTWVKKDDKWGLYNKETTRMVANASFNAVMPVSDSIAIIRDANTFKVFNYGKMKVVLDSIDLVMPLEYGLYSLQRKGKYGVLRKAGQLSVPFRYDTVYTADNAIYVQQKGLLGLYHLSGREVLPANYTAIKARGSYVAARDKQGRYALAFNNGKFITSFKYDYAEPGVAVNAIVAEGGRYKLLTLPTPKMAHNADGRFKLKQQGDSTINWSLMERDSRLGFIAAKSKGKYAILDNAGTIKLPATMDSIFVNDTSVVKRVLTGGSYALYNTVTMQSLTSTGYAYASPVESGYVLVKTTGWGALLANGKTALSPRPGFTAISRLAVGMRTYFVVGIAPTKGLYLSGDAPGQGTLVLPQQYDAIEHAGPATFKVKQNGKWGIVKLTGEVVLKPIYDSLATGTDAYPAIALKKGKYNLVNDKGEELCPKPYEGITSVGSGLFAYKKGTMYGLLAGSGKELTEAVFQEIGSYALKLAPAKQGDKWGYISIIGKFAIQPKYQQAIPFAGKSAYVQEGGKWGAIDIHGKYLAQPVYSSYTVTNGIRRLVN